MTTLTPMQKHQRLERRRTADTTPDRRRFRIIVLPAPHASDARHDSRSLQHHVIDDLDQATWEDAEWR
jgi:hypothetical protein